MSAAVAPFPRASRLTRPDEFSSVLGFRNALRSQLFVLYCGPFHPLRQTCAQTDFPAKNPEKEPQEEKGALKDVRSGGARLGLIVGKKILKLAVDRNKVKRIIREAFRKKYPELPDRDFVFRLSAKPEKLDRRHCQDVAADVQELLEKSRHFSRPKAAAHISARKGGKTAGNP